MAQKPKITPEQKETIIAQYNEGLSKYRIAKLHGISETMVRYIIHPEKVAENRKNTVKNNAKNLERVKRCLAKKKEQNMLYNI